MTDHKITSIKSLLNELEKGTGQDGYLGMMHKLQIPKQEVLPYCTWNNKHYTRNLLERNNDFELILMCWEPGQESLIHSYSDQEGWMFVIEGELTVNHYFKSSRGEKMQYYKEVQLRSGKFLYVNDYLGFHSATNSYQHRTISLHLHAGPVEKWKVYDPETNGFFIGKTRIDTDFQST